MFIRNPRLSQLMTSLVAIMVVVLAVAGCGAKDNSREIAKLEEELATKQATLVAVQDEIAETSATVEALRAEETAGPTLQPAAAPTKPATAEGKLHFVPTRISIGNAIDGWRNWEIQLALVNDTSETLEFGIVDHAEVITAEGFKYPADFKSSLGSVAVPAGFRVRSHPVSGSDTTLSFRAAATSTPAEVVLFLFPPQDDDRISYLIDITNAVTVEYPFSSDLDDISALAGARLDVPEKATIIFQDAVLIDAGYPHGWSLAIDFSSVNYDIGYSTAGSLHCNVFDHTGGVWHGQLSIRAGPGQTIQDTVLVGSGNFESVSSFGQSLSAGILFCQMSFALDPAIFEVFASLPSEFPVVEDSP